MAQSPGLGAEDFPGFPGEECPETLPNLSKHHSSMVDVLKQEPDLYTRLRVRRTPLGVGLARCIKVGIDNRGHHMVKSMGLVAGDEDCYETFRELFDPVIKRHLDAARAKGCDIHPTNLTTQGLSLVRADPLGRFVICSQVRMSRSLRGFRFPPAMSLDERAQVERICAGALMELGGSLQGDYFPLADSQTHSVKPGGMGPEDEDNLRTNSLLFEAPDSTLRLCTGAARHWPHARGIFVNHAQNFCVWINEQEHLRFINTQKGDALDKAFAELVGAMDEMAASMRRNEGVQLSSRFFSRSDRLGFLTSNPANLGSAMHISVTVKLPCLGSLETNSLTPPSWRIWCAQQRVQVRCACSAAGAPAPGLFEVSNCDRLGVSEVELVTLVNNVVARMVQLELMLEAGHPYDDLMMSKVMGDSSSSNGSVCHRIGSMEKAGSRIMEKARAGFLYGLASGRLADALCMVGATKGERSSVSTNVNAAILAATSRITAASPAPLSDAGVGSVEQACAHAVVAGIVDAVLVRGDDQQDRGSGVALSTTSPIGDAGPCNLHRHDSDQAAQALLSSIETRDVAQPEEVPSVPQGMPGSQDDDDDVLLEAPTSVDDLKDKAHHNMMVALEAGRLEQVMASALGVVEGEELLDPPEELDALRDKLHHRITLAIDEGKLDDMVEASLAPEHGDVLPLLKQCSQRKSVLVVPPAVPATPLVEESEWQPPPPPPPPQPPSQPAAPPKAEAAVLDVEAARQLQQDDNRRREEEVRLKARNVLMQAAFDESIDRAVNQVQAENAAALRPAKETSEPKVRDLRNTPDATTNVATPCSPMKESTRAARDPAAPVEKTATALALEVMCQRDRRVGELMALISETKKMIDEKDEQCTHMEDKLGTTRLDIAHLELDIEWHKRALDGAKERCIELEAGHRKLLGELDGHQQKLRHANIEAQESCLMTARSELSTATGGASTASGIGCFTPLNFINNIVLDPLALPSPHSARW